MTLLINELFLQKIFLSFLIGALLGLEREFTSRQEIAGLRTFSLISLLGCLTVVLSAYLQAGVILIGFAFICLFALAFYVSAKKKAGFTTNIALVITYVLGVLSGYGLFTEAIFLAILVAIVLFSKERMHSLVRHLTGKEVGDLLEFLILLGIVYPILPDSATVFGIGIPLMKIWWLIVLISIINFVAFIASRHFHTKYNVEIISFLGGLASSTAAAASLISLYRHNKKCLSVISASLLIATSGMLLRNFAFILVFAPQMVRVLVPPLVFATAAFVIVAVFLLHKEKSKVAMKIDSPFNVSTAAKLGGTVLVLFVLLNVATAAGMGYFFLSAFLGGMADSGGTSISLAGVVMQDPGSINSVAMGIMLACFGSAIANYLLCGAHGANQIVRKSILPMFSILAATAAFVYLLAIG